MRTSVQAVVIGGGVAGCSVAFHLARAGWTDVVVLEQHELGEGTSWHSAGFVGQLRSTISQTRMITYSTELYSRLAEITGVDPGWHPVGGLRLAATPERVEELHRSRSVALTYGLELELLSGREAAELLPLLDASTILEAAWIPTDGYIDPELLVVALAAGARQAGAEISEGVRVTGLDVAGGRIRAVETTHGRIASDVVVIAAGAASHAVGRLAGASIPVVPMRHQYVLTDPLEYVTEEMTTVRDPDRIVYFRPKGNALLVGGYARQPVLEDGADPLARPRTLYAADLERFAESWRGAETLLPMLRGRARAAVVHGPEAFTPDGEFILGETEVAGLWVGAGFCVHGVAGAGGVGKLLAEWIVDGQPEHDVSHMDIRRFGSQHRSSSYVRRRALDAYSRYYDIVYPGEERLDERPLRVSPVYARLLELDASFGEKNGWRRPNWFSSNAAGADAPRPAGWAGHSWSAAIGAECLAARDAAALFDQSSFGKLTVAGPDALATLERVCANRIDRPIGSLVYTQILNPRGGIEADVTVTRVGEEAFRVVTGTASPRRDLAWIARHVAPGARVELTDISGSEACLCLWGPESEAILGAICDDDIASDGFPFLTARRITVGGVPALAQRVSYVGEYGWELHCSAEYGLRLWDALLESGRPRGLIAGGYRAIDSMRIEKGYRVWGSDITPVTTPDEGGLRFAVAIDKPGGFVGRDALVEQRERGGPAQRLRALVLEDPRVVCLGNEPIRIEGQLAGRVTSGAYGHRIERSVAYGYVPADVAIGTPVEIGVFATWLPATVAPEPLYDPAGARLRDPGAEAVVAQLQPLAA